MPVWVLLLIHIICARALVFVLRYYASGELRRLLDETSRNELYLKRPTKFVHRLIFWISIRFMPSLSLLTGLMTI